VIDESRWSSIRERTLADPDDRRRYERKKRTIVLTRQLLMRIDEERERTGLSKAELARRIGASPSVVRRLFTSEGSNPTLRTVIEMLDELGIDLELTSSRDGDASTATSPDVNDRAPI
jgi:ribosome-binding protein aMBF1 (putative translation factor)